MAKKEKRFSIIDVATFTSGTAINDNYMDKMREIAEHITTSNILTDIAIVALHPKINEVIFKQHPQLKDIIVKENKSRFYYNRLKKKLIKQFGETIVLTSMK